MTVVSGMGAAMIPSGANAPRCARVTIASRCAAAGSQPKADTHGGESPRLPLTSHAVREDAGPVSQWATSAR
jgi:hypothetical protein